MLSYSKNFALLIKTKKEVRISMWKQIQNFNGNYLVNEFGEVKSNDRVIFNKGSNTENKIKGKILKQYKNNKGYLYVDLCKNGKSKHFLVHRLVAQAFIKNPNNFPIINHKDNNPTNNTMKNLEWCDYSYNIKYCIKQGRQNLDTDSRRNWVKSSKKYLWTPVIQYTLNLKEINRFENLTKAAEWLVKNNITKNKKAHSNISICCKNKAKTAYGFIWRYLE